MDRRTVRSFDPDADPAPGGPVDGDDRGGDGPWDGPWDDRRPPGRDRPLRLGDEPRPRVAPDDVWVDPVDGPADEAWVDPLEDTGDDTPTARADRAYGAAVDPATPAAVLRAAAEDLVTWDVEGLMAEAVVLAGAIEDTGPVPTGDRPEVVVLRSLLRHANRPDDLADVLLRGWLTDPVERSPWPAIIALGDDAPVDPDLVTTAVSEAIDAARADDPPAWSLVLTAAAAGRPDGGPVLDLLALVGFPHEQPVRLWPDASSAARGLPGGVRQQAGHGAEALGWDGRRLTGLPAALDALVTTNDRQRRDTSFDESLTLCAHGPVVVTPTSVTLPSSAAGARPYVALIVGSHPVFRLKRDWPDRSDGASGTVWTWEGPRVLESRGLGCDRCRQDRDRDKRYLLSTGQQVADVRLAQVQRAVEQCQRAADHDGQPAGG